MRHALLAAIMPVVLLLATPAARADPIVIANWTFETSQPTTAGPYVPEVGAGAASGFHQSASTYSSPSGNGSAHSFSSNTWGVGDYYQFTFASSGYTDLTLGFDQTSSSTGPGAFKVEVSTDGTTYTDLAGGSYSVLANSSPNTPWNTTTPNSAYSYTFDGLADGIVGIRLVDTSTIAAGGGPVGTGGTDRVDNVVISGVAVPEPSSLAMCGIAGVAGLVIAHRRRKRAA
jgi:hypothetical protein